MIKRWQKELIREKEKLVQFYIQEKPLRWGLAIIILITWGIRAVYGDVFIDSEIMMADPVGLMHSWFGSNRFGLIVTKKIFGMIRLVPYLSNVMFAIALWNTALLLCFAISRWKGDSCFSAAGKYLFCAWLVTAPCLAEQYAFTLQAFEVTMGMIYCLIAVYCSGKLIYDKGSLFWGIPALGFMVWGFGSYQALVAFYISLVIISFVSRNERESDVCGWKCAGGQILLFLSGFTGYLLLACFFKTWKGASSAYVDSMFLWGHQSVQTCLNNILLEFQKIYMGKIPLFFPRYYTFFVFFVVVLQIYHALIRKRKDLPLYLLAITGLAFAPLYISIITGAGTPMRGHLTFPLMLGYYGSKALEEIDFLAGKFLRSLKVKKIICGMSLLVGLFAAWRQGMNTVQLCETLHDAFVRDTLTAERMYMDVCQAADREDMQNCKVVFVGMRDARLPEAAVKGEAIGRSFYNWGATEIGVSNRANSLFNLLGMNLQSVTPDEYNLAVKACEGRESWPASEAVFIMDESDIVVVKLSE